MIIDPIIDELHQQRAEEMERFNFDSEAFYRHLKEQERLSGKPFVSPPESPPNLAVQRTRAARR
jgi:hypothetical protein